MRRSLVALQHVRRALLEGKLRRVHADDHQAGLLVLVGPGAKVGQGAQAVDARVGPEVDQHHLAAQAFMGQRGGVDPVGRTPPAQRGRLELPAFAQARARALPLPASGRPLRGERRRSTRGACGLPALTLSTSTCSRGNVVPSDSRLSTPVSRPSAMAPTPASTAAPAARRIHALGRERPLHYREQAPAEKERGGQRGARAGGVDQQQQRGADAGAIEGRAGQDQAEDRAGTRRPEQARAQAQRERRKNGEPRGVRVGARLGHPDPRARPAAGSCGRPGSETTA